MNQYKKKILDHYQNSIDFVKSLKRLSEKEWRTQIGEDKWTIAEVIGHFPPWDQFVMQHRIPYIFSDLELPKGPDTEKTNSASAKISRMEEKEETIHRFIAARKELYEAIQQIPDGCWEKRIRIGKTKMFLYEYFYGLMEHDRHHFGQINRTLQSGE